MYRTFIPLSRVFLGGILCMPFFVFAQTSTTTAEQPLDPFLQIQQDILRMTQRQIDDASSIEQITQKAISENLEVNTTPKNPGPKDLVNISIQSFLTDLDKASIVWTLNNKTVLSGTGKKTFSFKNGDSGETTHLTIAITANTGEVITKELSWTPVGVTLFWEADTYTPPFYRGKPLPSPQATVKVIATPDNTGGKNALSAGDLVYTWKTKGTADTTASGYGKNSYSFTGPKPYTTANISVQVSSLDDSVTSEAQVGLSLSSPFVLLYENNPLLGVIYNHPLGASAQLSGRELSINAAPFFFSNERSDTQTLRYNWSVNGKVIQNPSKDITLRNETGGKGVSLVNLAVSGLQQTFQTATQDLRINFTESNSSNKPIF